MAQIRVARPAPSPVGQRRKPQIYKYIGKSLCIANSQDLFSVALTETAGNYPTSQGWVAIRAVVQAVQLHTTARTCIQKRRLSVAFDGMTTPFERTRALVLTRDFLHRLSSLGDDVVPLEICVEAEALLRHYPARGQIELAHLTLPQIFGPAPAFSTLSETAD